MSRKVFSVDDIVLAFVRIGGLSMHFGFRMVYNIVIEVLHATSGTNRKYAEYSQLNQETSLSIRELWLPLR